MTSPFRLADLEFEPIEFGRRPSRRGKAIDMIHEASHVLRFGFTRSGVRWTGDLTRLAEVRTQLRVHLETHPELRS